MKKYNRFKLSISTAMICCVLGGTIVSAQDAPAMGPGNSNGSYSHGSETTVLDTDLKTTIPADYDVNSATQAKAKEGAYKKLFDTENMQDLYLTIDENNWNYILQNASDKPYVIADQVTIGEESISYVGIKPKGNLTLSQVWQSNSDRFSFTINVSKYVKKKNGYTATQNFYGLEKFSLNNIYGDASYMKEYLSYELMTDMGIATPYYCLVKVYVNNEFWGVYCMVENVDESLVKRTLDTSADGDLYKNEAPGGDLIYNTNLDSYLTGESTYDFSSYGQGGNVLSNYSGIFDNKEMGTTIEDYLSDLNDASTDEEKAGVNDEYTDTLTADANELFTWMKALNELSSTADANTQVYKESLESILNVDQALRYFAVNTYLVNLDSYQSEKQQNYCIYLLNGSATIIPWDYNYSFGGYGVEDASSMINFNIDTPVIDVTLAERPLVHVLLQNDEYRARYESYLNDCAVIATNGGTVTGTDYNGQTFTTTYQADYFSTVLSNYKETVLREALKETSVESPFYTYDQFTAAVKNLTQLINLRSKAVVKQINDDFTAVDSEGVDLSAIGNVTGGTPGGGQQGPLGGAEPPTNGMPGGTTPPADGTMPGGTPPEGTPTIPAEGTQTPPSDVTVTPTPEGTVTPTPESTVTPTPESTVTPTPESTPTTPSSGNESTGESIQTDTATETPTVTPAVIEAEKVTLNQKSAIMKVGTTVSLSAVVLPDTVTDKTVIYSSSDPSVAVVSEHGEVTALSEGIALITCTVKEGSSISDVCTIKVKKLSKVTKVKSSKTTKKTITLSWSKVEGTTGYQIYQYDSSKKKYVLADTVTTNSCKVKKLTTGTTYKFKICAYTAVSETTKTGVYSNVLKATTR